MTKKNETKLLQERKGERKLQSGVGITGENFITSLRLGEVDEGREGGVRRDGRRRVEALCMEYHHNVN